MRIWTRHFFITQRFCGCTFGVKKATELGEFHAFWQQ